VTRFDLDEMLLLIQRQRYFVLHAPRQVGKTSYLLALMAYLNGGDQYDDHRPQSFPQSVTLCRVRDVRDYRIHFSREKAVITGGSALNIKAKSLRLGDFERIEVESLYQQHIQETGQVVTPEAIESIWALSQGQPWLVNTLGYEVCVQLTGAFRGAVHLQTISEHLRATSIGPI
jgi:hypothetical protein